MTAAEAAKLQQQLQEIERLSRLLGANINTINLQPIEENAGNIEAIFQRLTNQAAGLGEETDYLVSNFQKLIGEIKKSSIGINEATKGLRNLSSITEQVSNYQKGYSDMTAKEIAKLRDKAKIETDRLKTARQTIEDETYELYLQSRSASFTSLSVKQQQAILDKLAKNQIARENINNLLENEDITLGELNNKLKEAEDSAKRMEKTLGLTGATLKGISKIPILGDIIDTNSALKAAKDYTKEAGLGATRIGAMRAAFKDIGDQIKENLTDPLVIVGFLVTEIISTFKSVDSAIGDMAKGLDISYNSAANLRMELTDIANFSGDAAVNTRGLQESLMAVSQTMGINARLTDQDLITFTKLREQAGYTNDELVSIQKISTINGKTVEATSKSFLGTVARLNAQNKLAINAKQLFKDIANVSDAIKLSVGGTADKIAEAAYKARQFGISLQQADQISESLLNFESSIANELSAELITGKDLNFEKARLLAINGDIAGASEEILKQIKGSAEFTKMNRIQQEALAKAVGMSRDDLAKSLLEREAAAKLGAAEGQSAQDAYNTAVKKYGIEKANQMLNNEALQTQFQQQSAQERFANAVEKLKEIFVSLVEPLMPIVDIFADIFGYIAPVVGFVGTIVKYTVQWGKYLLPLLAAYKAFQITSYIFEARKTAQLALQGNAMAIQNIMLEKSIVKRGVYHAIALKEAITENGIAGVKAYALSLDEKSLARRIIMFGWNLKDSIITKTSAAWEAIKKSSIIAQISKLPVLLGLKSTEAAIATETAAATVAAAETVSFGAATAWILAGLGAVMGGIAAYAMKDGIIDPKKGPIVSGGFGSVQLSPKDTGYFNGEKIIAGTNLGGGANSTSQQDNSALIAEMRAMRQEQARSNAKPTVVENSMNGTKFGTSVAMNTYKIQ